MLFPSGSSTVVPENGSMGWGLRNHLIWSGSNFLIDPLRRCRT